MYRFPRPEREALSRDAHLLITRALEVHFDAAALREIAREMAKSTQIEIGAELAIDSRQQIQVERRGHPLRIVIRGIEQRRSFLQIDTYQRGAASAQRRRPAREERVCIGRREIPDGRAGK